MKARNLLLTAALVAALAVVVGGTLGAGLPHPMRTVAMMYSSDGSGSPGTFTYATGSGGTTVAYVPPPAAMMYSTDGSGTPGTFAYCGASCFNGNITPQLTPTNCTITANGCSTTGSTNVVTISGIPAGHELIIYVSGTMAATSEMTIQFDTDTGADYASQYTRLNGSTALPNTSTVSQTAAHAGNLVSTGTFVGTDIITIPNYSGTTAGKVAHFNSESFGSISSATSNFLDIGVALWSGPASCSPSCAINSFTLRSNGSTFTNGTLIYVVAI